MERLTYRDAHGGAWYSDAGTEADRLHFIADVEDILGDDYDLDWLRELCSHRMTMREDAAARMRLVGSIPLDLLRELVEADRDGRCVVQEYNPGDPVWVVERDEIDEPDCVSGYVFVAYADGVVIVHPYIGDCGEIDAILYDCITETRENGECDLEVFPIEDCYCSKEDAKNALKGDRHETD